MAKSDTTIFRGDEMIESENMRKSVIIDGGFGRQLCAEPALEKFIDRNPDGVIITHFWTPIFWGNRKIAKNIIDASTKGTFDILKKTKIIKPEPYYNNDFINGRINLIDAFNREINGDSETMRKPKIYLTKAELNAALNFIDSSKKNIVFQPFGSEAVYQNGDIIDSTNRSLNKDNALELMNVLKREGYNVIIFDNRQYDFINQNDFKVLNNLQIRESAAVVANCDYFLGVDSSGQHIAYSFNKPGSVFFGTTNPDNFGYKEHFGIFQKDEMIEYSYPRVSDFDMWFNNINYDGVMHYNYEEMQEITHHVLADIKNKC